MWSLKCELIRELYKVQVPTKLVSYILVMKTVIFHKFLEFSNCFSSLRSDLRISNWRGWTDSILLHAYPYMHMVCALEDGTGTSALLVFLQNRSKHPETGPAVGTVGMVKPDPLINEQH